jgi:FMN-dependent NADH-azoreductase
MYNFSIPSTLKAWIDHVARAGRTFRYTEGGPEGLLKGKKVFVVTARGGHYSGESPNRAYDFQEPYLRAVLGFVGLDDVTFLHLEGLKISPEAAADGRARARAELSPDVIVVTGDRQHPIVAPSAQLRPPPRVPDMILKGVA